MVKAVVAGIAGRMGTRISQLIQETPGIELAGGVEFPKHPKVGADLCEAIGGSPTGITISGSIADALTKGDVVIDFTSAAVSLANLEVVAGAGKAMVIGSTGFSAEQTARAGELAKKVPCVLAPNMSRGVNILFELVAEAARLLGDSFDVEIVEAHHRHKKDAPSGTAVRLAEVAAKALNRDLGEVGRYSRHGIIGERDGREIGIQTLRGGDIVGEHTVLFAGRGERIEITHRAHNRDNFAGGAIQAAIWVAGREPGLYGMRDVLGIR